MQLWTLVQAMGPILQVLSAQTLVITFFAVFIIFHQVKRKKGEAMNWKKMKTAAITVDA